MCCEDQRKKRIAVKVNVFEDGGSDPTKMRATKNFNHTTHTFH